MRKFLASEAGVFFKTVTSSAMTNGVALAISMIGSVLLTRALGAEGRGVVAWITSLMMIAASMLQFGLGPVGRRFIAEDKNRAGDLILGAILLSLIGACIILPFFIWHALSDALGPRYTSLVWIGMFAAPVVAIVMNLREMLLGLKLTRQFNLLPLLQKGSNSLLIIALVLLATATPFWAVSILLLSYLLQLIGTVIWLKPYIKDRKKNTALLFKHMKSFIAVNYLATLLLNTAHALPTVFLASLYSAKAAGLYAACAVLTDAAFTSVRMVGMHTLPQLAGAADVQQRKKLVKHSLLITLLFGVLGAVVYLVLSGWLLPFLFGHEFAEAIPAFRIMSLGMVCYMLFNTIQSSIIARQKGWVILVGPSVMFVTIVVSGLLLIPTYGAVGGSITFALTGAATLFSGIVTLFFRRHLL